MQNLLFWPTPFFLLPFQRKASLLLERPDQTLPLKFLESTDTTLSFSERFKILEVDYYIELLRVTIEDPLCISVALAPEHIPGHSRLAFQ